MLAKRKKGQILVITLIVLTILSIVTVSLIVLNNRDVSQVVNSEVYDKVYNSSESTLKQVLNSVADPSVVLSPAAITASLAAPNNSPTLCTPVGGAITGYQCKFTLPSDSDPTIQYSDTLTVSNEKDIVDFSLAKDRPLTLSLAGYSSFLTITTNKAVALDFTLVYLDASGTYQTYSGVYDPTSGAYSSTGLGTPAPAIVPLARYVTVDPTNPLSFKLALPAMYSAFQLLSITPRLTTPGDSILITVKADAASLATYPAQIRKFISQAYTVGNSDSPLVNLVTQIPLTSQLDGLLDYSLLTPDTVKVGN